MRAVREGAAVPGVHRPELPAEALVLRGRHVRKEEAKEEEAQGKMITPAIWGGETIKTVAAAASGEA